MTDFISPKAIASLAKVLWDLRDGRDQILASISREFGPIDHIAKHYVEPECQHHNPADWDERENFASSIRIPVFRFVNQFLANLGPERDGKHQLFILGDAGMGKTSLLVMLRLAQLNRFWPTKIKCVLLKLNPNTLETIQAIADPGNTILLLDSLDEDSTAFGRVEERLTEILHATQPFRKTIISCRTQYFPKSEKGPFDSVGRIRIGGFVCPTAFLSWFSDDLVDNYLRRRFPGQSNKIQKAKLLVSQMGSLRLRPLLLSYIEEIMEAEIDTALSEYAIYAALVDFWLLREQRKLFSHGMKVAANELLDACIQLAIWMQKYNTRIVSLEQLSELRRLLPGFRNLEEMNIEGRSLLNRTSEGCYRFAHYSIQEFLVVHGIDKNVVFPRGTKFLQTDLTMSFLAAIGTSQRDYSAFTFDKCLFEDFDFSNANFNGAKLDGTVFRNCIFNQARLQHCSAKEVDFTGSSFVEADLTGSDLRSTCFYSVNLQDARIGKQQLLDMRFNDVTGDWIEVADS